MSPPARLLDLTRLVSRLGRGPLTGVDRVEAAYLARLLAEPVPLWGLVRTFAGLLLLDADGVTGVLALARGEGDLGTADPISRLFLPGAPERARAESAARRLALARAARPGYGRMLRRLPERTSYINTGHANLAPTVRRVLQYRGMQVAVLIHDTIPLDHPGFVRPGVPEDFARKLGVAAGADLVIHTAQTTRRATEAHLARLGRVPQGIVAPLGVETARPEPSGIAVDGPYFVALGTIEPRKNLSLLLDVWDRMPADGRPTLLLIGRRGWERAEVLDRIARTPGVRECPGLSDGQVAQLLMECRALLFPSFAEGFGLPPWEAAVHGTPVVAAPLPVFAELLGDYPIYRDPTDTYAWQETILRLARMPERRPALVAPAWDDHFKTVLTHI